MSRMPSGYSRWRRMAWVGAFDEDSVRKALDIPEDLVVAGILALGVADQKPPVRSRKSIEELFSKNSYTRSFRP